MYIFLILLINFINNQKKYINFIHIVIFSFSTLVTLTFQKIISLKLDVQTNITNYNIKELFEIFFSPNINFERINSINIFQGSLFRIPNQIIEILFLKSEYLYEFKANLLFWFIFVTLLNIAIFLLNKKKIYRKNKFTIIFVFCLYFAFFFNFSILQYFFWSS